MTVKHTPGPWNVSEIGRYIEALDGEATIAQVRGFDGRRDSASRVDDDANAQLIAAAPALADDAEKLTALLAHIVEFAHYATDDDTPDEVLARIENEAREVAKAVGYDGSTCAALRAAGRLP